MFIKISVILLLFLSITQFVYTKESVYLWVTAENGLAIRSDSSTSSKIIKIIPFGEKIEFESNSGKNEIIENIKGEWFKIRWGAYSGYIFSGFTSTADSFINDYHIAVAKKGLPCMAIDKKYYDSNLLIPYGAIVKVIKKLDDPSVSDPWNDKIDLVLIKYNNKEFKVNKNFLEPVKSKKHSENIKKTQIKLIEAFVRFDKEYMYNFDPNDYAVFQLGDYLLITSYFIHGPGAEEVLGFHKYLFRITNDNYEYVNVMNTGRSSSKIILTDLNNDNHPDVIAYGLYSVMHYVYIYMGQKDGSVKLTYKYDGYSVDYSDLQEIKITDSEVELIYKGSKYIFDKNRGMILQE